MAELVGTYPVGQSMRCEMWTEPPRRRSILTRYGQVLSLSWPWLVFEVMRGPSGQFVQLSVMMAEDKPAGPNSRVHYIRLPNIHGVVCLGTALDAVKRGELDPIDAFWNSAFEWDAFTPAAIQDHLKPEMGTETTAGGRHQHQRQDGVVPLRPAPTSARVTFMLAPLLLFVFGLGGLLAGSEAAHFPSIFLLATGWLMSGCVAAAAVRRDFYALRRSFLSPAQAMEDRDPGVTILAATFFVAGPLGLTISCICSGGFRYGI